LTPPEWIMFLPYRSAPSVYPQSARRDAAQETPDTVPTGLWLLCCCSEAIGPYWRVTMILTAIVVTGLVFTGIGATIGYVLGFIEAENRYRMSTGPSASVDD
jgi:hypothetical protein